MEQTLETQRERICHSCVYWLVGILSNYQILGRNKSIPPIFFSDAQTQRSTTARIRKDDTNVVFILDGRKN